MQVCLKFIVSLNHLNVCCSVDKPATTLVRSLHNAALPEIESYEKLVARGFKGIATSATWDSEEEQRLQSGTVVL